MNVGIASPVRVGVNKNCARKSANSNTLSFVFPDFLSKLVWGICKVTKLKHDDMRHIIAKKNFRNEPMF